MFRRRSSISTQSIKPSKTGVDITSATHRRCGSMGDIEIINIDDETEKGKNGDKKRKADLSPGSLREDLAQPVPKAIKELQEKVNDLVNFAGANKNAHKEVKQMVQYMKKLISQSMKEIQQLKIGTRTLPLKF